MSCECAVTREEVVHTAGLIRAIRRECAMIVVEQHLEFVAALSSRVLVIQKGAIFKEPEAATLGESARPPLSTKSLDWASRRSRSHWTSNKGRGSWPSHYPRPPR